MKNLNDDQTRVAQRCLVLEANSAAADSGLGRATVGFSSAAAQARAVKGSWVKLQSTSPFVSMSIKYTKPEGNNESRCVSRELLTHEFERSSEVTERVLAAAAEE
jgi:hypothetical protein